jgi:hypothetical protein
MHLHSECSDTQVEKPCCNVYASEGRTREYVPEKLMIKLVSSIEVNFAAMQNAIKGTRYTVYLIK